VENKYAGGNSVCDRPTPDWQKSIGGFLLQSTKAKGKENSTPSAEVEAGGNSECGSSQSSEFPELPPPRAFLGACAVTTFLEAPLLSACVLTKSTKAKGKENSTPSAEVEAGGNSECGSSQSSDARQSSTADTD
jgi:hypothetical protein